MSTRVRIADFVLDRESGALTRRGRTEALPELSLRVLEVLIRHAPDTVSTQTLTQEAWGRKVVSEDTLAQRIKLLRKAFGETGQDARVILTVRGEGYRLGVPVEAAGKTPVLGRRTAWIGGGIAGAVLLGALGWGVAATVNGPRAEAGLEQGPSVQADPVMRRVGALMMLHQADETERAIALLRQARLDQPERIDYAIALSVALSTQVTKFGFDPVLAQEAETLAREATESASGGAEAWHALGYSLDSQSRVSEALAAYQQAYLRDPTHVNAMSSAAYLLSVRGQLYEALVLDVRALEAGGGSLYAELQIGRSLSLLGERALASQWLERALQLNADHPVVTLGVIEIELSRGDDEAAAARLAAFPEADVTHDLRRVRGDVAFRQGDRDAAIGHFNAAGPAAIWERAIQDTLAGGPAPSLGLDPDGIWPGSRVHAARLAAAGGAIDSAFDHLDEAVDLGWRDAEGLTHRPVLAPLRSDPRWLALMDRIQREIAAQRALLDADPELRAKLDIIRP